MLITEEIYVLTKHANFDAGFLENLPVYKRRYFLHLLQKENEEIEKIQDRERNKMNNTVSKRR